MLLFRTTVKPSRIHGLGVFAAELIPAGAKVWEFDPQLDSFWVNKEGILKYPPAVQAFLYPYLLISLTSGLIILHGDNARYINDSEAPNLGIKLNLTEPDPSGDYTAWAQFDIEPGTELTWRYEDFDDIDLSEDNLFALIRKNTGIEPDELDRKIEGLPEPLCEDEGCPNFGTSHVCFSGLREPTAAEKKALEEIADTPVELPPPQPGYLR